MLIFPAPPQCSFTSWSFFLKIDFMKNTLFTIFLAAIISFSTHAQQAIKPSVIFNDNPPGLVQSKRQMPDMSRFTNSSAAIGFHTPTWYSVTILLLWAKVSVLHLYLCGRIPHPDMDTTMYSDILVMVPRDTLIMYPVAFCSIHRHSTGHPVCG